MRISKHHYALELSDLGNKVYFIGPASKRIKKGGLNKVNDNLWLVNYSLVARGETKLPRWLYDTLVKKEVQLLMRIIKDPPDIIWCFNVFKLHFIKFFNAPLRIFHPVDFYDHSRLNKIEPFSFYFSPMKREVEWLIGKNYNAYYLSHGLSKHFLKFAIKKFNFYNDKNQPPLKINFSIKVGYAGNLMGESMDREMMKKVIHENSDCEFNFWGNYNLNENELARNEFDKGFIDFLVSMPNVKLNGLLTTKKLAVEYQNMDMFWICWKTKEDSMWNTYTRPHKILEYLSTGSPVITHYIADYENKDFVIMASKNNIDYNTLFNKLVKQLREQPEETTTIVSRIEYALKCSYKKNIEKVERIINGSD